MSTENESPIESSSKQICGICEAIIASDDPKLICTSEQCGKLTCLSCIKKMIEVMFGQPALNYPLKCGGCSEIFDQTVFLEYIINQGQYEKYLACIFPLYWAKDCLKENEVLAQCKNFKEIIFFNFINLLYRSILSLF